MHITIYKIAYYFFIIIIFHVQPALTSQPFLRVLCVPVGGACDSIQGHHWEGVSAQGYHQHTGSQPFQQTHRPGAGRIPQGGGAEPERAWR